MIDYIKALFNDLFGESTPPVEQTKSKKQRKKPDHTKLTQDQIDFVVKSYNQYFYGTDDSPFENYTHLGQVTEYLNHKLLLDKSTTSYRRIYKENKEA